MCGYCPVKFFSRSYTATGKNFLLTFLLYLSLHVSCLNLSFLFFVWLVNTCSFCEVLSLMFRDLVQTNKKFFQKKSVTAFYCFNLLLLGRGVFLPQAVQGGGHRTLLYGHAILLRHSFSGMVRMCNTY